VSEYLCTIEARMTSSRLPGKVLMEHMGKSMLEIMISRLLPESRIKKIVIATTTNPQDDVIEAMAAKIGVAVYRGSEENVLSRIIEVCARYSYKHLVALTGDCPLIATELVSSCIDDYEKYKPDYLSNAINRELPDGMDCQVLAIDSLRRLTEYPLTQLDNEHVTIFIRNHPELFTLRHRSEPKSLQWPELALTLDEKPDFDLISRILDHFYPRLDFSLSEIIDFLRISPELLELNSSVIRKGDA
jgi:spore coat polysaccharide biosynthesis protein SpsF